MTRKRIVVTGGAGFIGSHLCERLLDEAHTVMCIDNLFTGSEENIRHLQGRKDFEFVNFDITKGPFFVTSRVDEIYNLACPASPIHYQRNPVETILANTVGVVNILEIARQQKARILQASTSEIYGDPTEHPQRETYRGNVSTTGPRACYDEGKRVAETLFAEYKRQYGVNIKIARIFNTYGPRMSRNDGRVISNFILQALTNENITISGDGSQTRSFCYVSDMVDGLIRLMHERDLGTPVNLGNPTETRIIDIANKIKELTASESQIVYYPLPEDDPKQRKPDITLAETRLSWYPRVGLEEGLRKTIDYLFSLVHRAEH